MIGRFVQNRIMDLQATAASLIDNSKDPYSKGSKCDEDVAIAVSYITRAVDVLVRTKDLLDIEDHARWKQSWDLSESSVKLAPKLGSRKAKQSTKGT
jgi:hypothetical protein